jgi:hypothetical protein
MAVGGECRQLLLQLRGVAFGALRFLLPDQYGFELVTALCTKIFKDWHDHSRVRLPYRQAFLP